MRITLHQLNESYPALRKIAQQEFPKDRHKLAYKLSRVLKCANTELEAATESLNDLMRRCGFEPNEQGVSEEKRSDYQTQFTKFMKETSCDLWGDPIHLDEFAGIVPISPFDLALLDWLIIDGFPSAD